VGGGDCKVAAGRNGDGFWVQKTADSGCAGHFDSDSEGGIFGRDAGPVAVAVYVQLCRVMKTIPDLVEL
jgi:hypothetical protein